MNGIYPVQVIALDEIAQQALGLAELTWFGKTIKMEIDGLVSYEENGGNDWWAKR